MSSRYGTNFRIAIFGESHAAAIGVEIEGVVPNWELMKKGVIDICRFMPELEYLGFDIAITDDGFKIIEINIHQDLHKVAEHSEEFKSFYRDKLRLKAEKYGLNKW